MPLSARAAAASRARSSRNARSSRAAACVIALAIASAAIRLLTHAGSLRVPRASEIGIGAGGVIVAVTAALAIALVTTAAVIWNQRRRSTIGELRESGRGQSPGRSHLRLRLRTVDRTDRAHDRAARRRGPARPKLPRAARDRSRLRHEQRDDDLAVAPVDARDTAAATETARRYQTLIDALRAVPGVTAVAARTHCRSRVMARTARSGTAA